MIDRSEVIEISRRNFSLISFIIFNDLYTERGEIFISINNNNQSNRCNFPEFVKHIRLSGLYDSWANILREQSEEKKLPWLSCTGSDDTSRVCVN